MRCYDCSQLRRLCGNQLLPVGRVGRPSRSKAHLQAHVEAEPLGQVVQDLAVALEGGPHAAGAALARGAPLVDLEDGLEGLWGGWVDWLDWVGGLGWLGCGMGKI
jgi:hypothetical protein